MPHQTTLSYARSLDQEDPLRPFRQQFHIPSVAGKEAIYFCGNSLGLQPKTARQAVEREMEKWEQYAVEGHFRGEDPWFTYHELLTPATARLVGAKPAEVVVMNNLTTNLHLMLVSFYRPAGRRFKIITEFGGFPSDQYALESQVRFHGYDPDVAIVELRPREGEHLLRTEDIVRKIGEEGEELALIMLGGVNYYTGQFFDLQAITRAGHAVGVPVGFDLAHAAGNLPLRLHDWGVDFGVWCSYKYLNSSPGGSAGAFVHDRHAHNPALPRFAGWWGHNQEERFQMNKGFKPMAGAAGWQLSNSAILPMAVHRASLEIFDAAGMDPLRQKSLRLTGYLEFLIRDLQLSQEVLEIITPADPEARGCQLSLLVHRNGRELFDKLSAAGVIGDWREPNVIRLAPLPLYNTFEEVWRLGQLLREFMGQRAG
ncbi:kynureninase [soil metagenome]